MVDSSRFVSQQQQSIHRTAHEESVREMEQIRHTNATLEKEDQTFRGQTNSADIRIVTPIFKTGEKPGADVKIGASVADLNAKFEQAESDYKAERMAEQYRLQIIDPKVTSHAYIPAHIPRDWERKKLMEDFPSLHGKRSFLDLDALEQLKIRKVKPVTTDISFARIPDAKPWKTPAAAIKDDDNIRELDRLRNNLDNLQKNLQYRSKSLNDLDLQKFSDSGQTESFGKTNGFSRDSKQGELITGRIRHLLQHSRMHKAQKQAFWKPKPFRIIERHIPPTDERIIPKETFKIERTTDFDQEKTRDPTKSCKRSGQKNFEKGILARTFEKRHYKLAKEENFGPHFELDFMEIRQTHSNFDQDGQTMMDDSQNPSSIKNQLRVPKSILREPQYFSELSKPQLNGELRERQQIYDELLNQYNKEITKLNEEYARIEGQMFQQMSSNLARQNEINDSKKNTKYPVSKFEGPFFQLAEVGNGTPIKIPLTEKQPEEDGRVVFWPPLDYENNKKVEPPEPQNIRDKQHVNEYQRQLAIELQNIQRKKEHSSKMLEKQVEALNFQQLAIQQNINAGRTNANGQTLTPHSSKCGPPFLGVFETLPISSAEILATSRQSPEGLFETPGEVDNTWRRTYILDRTAEKADEVNEILKSGEILQRERFAIDLIKLRENFIEKPEEVIEIKRLGRRWQPPPDDIPQIMLKRYTPITVETATEHQWIPVVSEPEYRSERKSFSPAYSPPGSPILGFGTESLDEVAKRQIRDMIIPSPDGSHRPSSAFKAERNAPTGGFYPHAPNAIKTRPSMQTSKLIGGNETIRDEISPMASSRGQLSEVSSEFPTIHQYGNDLLIKKPTLVPVKEHCEKWDIVEQLPLHSSVVVSKDVPLPKGRVKNRIKQFSKEYRLNRAKSLNELALSPRTETVERSLSKMQQYTQPSPPPLSYESAKPYIPPPLPPRVKNRSIPKIDIKLENTEEELSFPAENASFTTSVAQSERIVTKTEFPPLPARREIVQVRKEIAVKPQTTHKVHRVEERKRTEEVERRIIRRERRHKSHRTYKSHGHSSGGHHEYSTGWHGANGYRGDSATRSGFNGFGDHHLPITYGESKSRSASHMDYGPFSESFKYGTNGDTNIRASRMHKSHSTRDVFHRDGGGERFSSISRREPVTPIQQNSGAYSPIQSRIDEFDGYRSRPLVKARSYADQDWDMMRLENEFRDSHLMRIPDGKVSEREYRHQEIPGGYEMYERETKADSGRRLNREGVPADFSEAYADSHFKREVNK